MSFYNGSIKCREFQPNSNSTNYRTEFRLPSDKVYLANMRVLNVGVKGVAGGEKLNQLVGSLGVIKSLTLLDGNEQLDASDNFNMWAGWKSYNTTNDKNLSINYRLHNNAMGQVTDGSLNTGEDVKPLRTQVDTTDNVANTPKCWISLSDYLPFLEASNYLPTNVFRNLRLVIEYETDVDNITPNGTDPLSTLEPFLVVDELENPDIAMQVMKEYQGVTFRPIENSRVVLPALVPTVGAPNPTQAQTFTIQGFNDKTVDRLLLVKEQTATKSPTMGRLGSVGQFQETVQYNVNGANLLQGAGLTTRNQTLAMLYDLYGDCDGLMPNTWLSEASNNYEQASDVGTQLEYAGVNIGQFVQNFQLQYGRTGQFDSTTGATPQSNLLLNQQLNLQLFAEVQKQLSMRGDGSYAIRYL